MSAENETITVRVLSHGSTHSGILRSWNGHVLHLELRPDAHAHELTPGALVEVDSQENMYLGEIQGRQGAGVLIGVEHRLDRQALTDIQRVWHPST